MKKIKFDLNNNPFINFQSSRYSISARVNVENTYTFCKQNNYSFFITVLGCLIKASNSIVQFKRRIINNEVIEFSSMDATCPIMKKEDDIYKEMRVKPNDQFENFKNWHDYVKKEQNDILSLKKESFTIPMDKRDEENIINFSCVPWLDFDSVTTCIENGRQIQPLITWGKFNKEYEMTISLTVNHIFINGYELAEFYKIAQYYLNNPEKL